MVTDVYVVVRRESGRDGEKGEEKEEEDETRINGTFLLRLYWRGERARYLLGRSARQNSMVTVCTCHVGVYWPR